MRMLLVMSLLLAVPALANDVDPILAIEQELTVHPGIKQRIEKFLTKHKVKHPGFYARLLDKQLPTEKDKKLFAAKLVVETRGDASAVSSEGAIGPWQLHPCWFKKFGKARRPSDNLRACYKVYNIHLEDAKGNRRKASYAYSGGAKWYPDRVFKLAREI